MEHVLCSFISACEEASSQTASWFPCSIPLFLGISTSLQQHVLGPPVALDERNFIKFPFTP